MGNLRRTSLHFLPNMHRHVSFRLLYSHLYSYSCYLRDAVQRMPAITLGPSSSFCLALCNPLQLPAGDQARWYSLAPLVHCRWIAFENLPDLSSRLRSRCTVRCFQFFWCLETISLCYMLGTISSPLFKLLCCRIISSRWFIYFLPER